MGARPVDISPTVLELMGRTALTPLPGKRLVSLKPVPDPALHEATGASLANS